MMTSVGWIVEDRDYDTHIYIYIYICMYMYMYMYMLGNTKPCSWAPRRDLRNSLGQIRNYIFKHEA